MSFDSELFEQRSQGKEIYNGTNKGLYSHAAFIELIINNLSGYIVRHCFSEPSIYHAKDTTIIYKPMGKDRVSIQVFGDAQKVVDLEKMLTTAQQMVNAPLLNSQEILERLRDGSIPLVLKN